MDINIRIIEGVRERPSLYDSTSSISERKHNWKQLADKLRLQEQFLKIRWHLLLQRYQQDRKFKYKCEMLFLESHLAKKLKMKTEQMVKQDEKPEFVITEKDIKERSDQDDYVFLEVEELESNTVKEQDVLEETTNLQTVLCCSGTGTGVFSKAIGHDIEYNAVVEEDVRTDRCEDMIFGELVAAMLRRMDAEKKRTVKKNIMNILLA